MDRLPVELLYMLAIAGFVLFNFFLQKAQRRQQEEAAAGEAAQPQPAEAESLEDEPPQDYWGRGPALPQVAPAPPVHRARAVEVPRPRRRHPVRALLSDPRDLRRAVVLTMVLGPCRAQEPPDR
jgi:hypothetical protein